MNHSYIFEFEDIILKPLEEADIEELRILRNKERRFFATQNEISQEGQKSWYLNYLDKANDIMFKIVKRAEPDTFIGAIALYDIDWEKKQSECGRTVIDKELAPEKGIGLTATKAVCLFGFEVLKLEKIIGEVLKTNGRIIKVDTRAGFYIVGEADDCYNIEMTPNSINIEKRKTIFDYSINEKASVSGTVTEEAVKAMAGLSGDQNPLHMDEEYAKKGPFGRRIAHGLFCLGLVSNVIGNILPGRGAVLLKQDFKYRRPAYIGDEITATVEIVEIDGIRRNMLLRHTCVNQDQLVVLEGTSTVRVN